ncbi:unnamed protein product [Owenia fusiformis]|uniref:Uncharacterized protein n=1 Tax=Owenia fusiformis TaxID=6347 RepID=A0A8J1TV97_OWEFU|nr:unnamed protein product [Owenia fusiformis]
MKTSSLTVTGLAIAIVIPLINADCNKPAFYLGCFKDTNSRDMHGLGIQNGYENSLMTVEMCTDHCRTRGFKYAGLQYARHCFCGDKFGKYGLADSDSECRMTCQGDPSQNCGAAARNSVYLIR